MVYRVYLRWWSVRERGEIDPALRTVTPSPETAETASRALIRCPDLTGQPCAAVLSLNQRLLMYQRFDRGLGDVDWVDPEGPIRLSHDRPRGGDDGHL